MAAQRAKLLIDFPCLMSVSLPSEIEDDGGSGGSTSPINLLSLLRLRRRCHGTFAFGGGGSLPDLPRHQWERGGKKKLDAAFPRPTKPAPRRRKLSKKRLEIEGGTLSLT